MANENSKKRRKKLRQEWNPHWSLKTLYTLGSTALSVAKIAIGAALTVALILLICGVVFVGTLGDYLQDDILTEASDWSIDDYDLEKTSFLYYVDSNGDIQQLQQIYTTTDRQIATLDEIPQDLINATVAIEDKRSYEHQGVDWITTVKACMNMFFGGDSQFGGSTITQQLIKNVSQENSITVQRKVMEIFRAQMFEKEYDKDLIMYEYLNRIYLENGDLDVILLGQGFTWLDTGTHESLVEATNFVKTVETHQHRKIACLEEIAYLNGWISKEEVLEAYEVYKKNQYRKYLKDVLDGKYVDKIHQN